MQVSFSRLERPLAYMFLVAAVVIYALQLRSLYTTPVYDSVRWGGDETWLMREFGNQATHGAMQYPETFGEAPRTDGMLAGSMWVNALLYGVTGNTFFPAHDLISIGRTVTSCLGLLLIGSFFYIARKLGVGTLLASAATLLLVCNQGFLWATHSARYDVMTGLVLVGYIYALSRLETEQPLSRSLWFFVGIASVLTIIFSRHMLTLGAPVTLLLLIRQRIWQQLTGAGAYLAGVLSATVVLAVVYTMGSGELSLFGRGGSFGSYSFVLQQIPIMRPLSRSVQISNLLERTHLFWVDARGVFYVFVVLTLLVLTYKAWQFKLRRESKSLRIATRRDQRFVLIAASLSLLSWILLQGARPYYLYHIVPAILLGALIMLQWLDEVLATYRYGALTGAVLVLAGLLLQADHALPQGQMPEFVSKDQRRATRQLLHTIDSVGDKRPRVLVDVAVLDWALQDTTKQILTLDMFQPPPESGRSAMKLLKNRIDYVILRSSPVSTPFEPGRELLPHVLDSTGIRLDRSLGFFYDDGRQYGSDLDRLIVQGLDTLTLWKVRR